MLEVDVERAQSYASQLEKRQKGFDKVVEDWRRKTDDLSAELDAAQRECRNLSTDVFKLRNTNEEIQEQVGMSICAPYTWFAYCKVPYMNASRILAPLPPIFH